MNTLKEDLKAPLDKVQRAWIRKPTTLILTPALFICAFFIIGIHQGYVNAKEFFIECW